MNIWAGLSLTNVLGQAKSLFPAHSDMLRLSSDTERCFRSCSAVSVTVLL